MRYSENLHLNLPEDSDPLEIAKISENFEALDGAIKEPASASGYKVGDTLTTWRTDLGEDWLLCNGGTFWPDEYPELANVTPDVYSLLPNTEIMPITAIIVGGASVYKSIISLAIDPENTNNALMVVVYWTGNIDAHALVYTTDGFRTSAKMTNPPRVSSSSYEGPYAVFYCNGYWIVFSWLVGMWSIYATRTLEDAPTWEGGQTDLIMHTGIGSSAPFNRPFLIEYVDGQYYMFMNGKRADKSGSPRIVTSNTPWFSDYVEHTVVHTNVVTATDWYFVKTEHYYVYVGTDVNRTKITDILYATNPLGPYTERQFTNLPLSFNNAFGQANSVAHCPHGDILMFASHGSIAVNGVSTDCNVVQYIEDIKSGGVQYVYQPYATARKYLDTPQFIYRNNKYTIITSGGAVFAISDIHNPEGLEYQGLLKDTLSYTGSISLNALSSPKLQYASICNAKEFKVYGSAPKDSTSTTTTASLITIPIYAVPCVDISNLYTYIKVKEEPENGNQQADTPAP